MELLPSHGDDEQTRLLNELNNMVSECLRLDEGERALIHDLVHVRLALNDGRTGRAAARSPRVAEIRAYAKRLRLELDDFVGEDLPKCHQVDVVYDSMSGMIQVNLVSKARAAGTACVAKADHATARELEKTRRRLRTERAQWVYFDRNLRVYEGTRTYILKPMQRFHWTESQAMVDARSIIAETLEGVGAEA